MSASRYSHVSVEVLASGERCLELTAIPTDETTPESAAATRWGRTGSLDDWETAELPTTPAERSLIQIT